MVRYIYEKKGKLTTSHRSTQHPCFGQDLGDSWGAGRVGLTRAQNYDLLPGSPNKRPYLTFVCRLEFYFWGFRGSCLSLELRFSLEAEPSGIDVGGEFTDGGVVFHHGLSVTAAGSGDAVLCAFELHL